MSMDSTLLILACSNKKLDLPKGEMVEAGSLYTGRMFSVLKKWMRRHGFVRPPMFALILSPKYGLVMWDTLLENYDQDMTLARAKELRPQVEEALRANAASVLDRVYVDLGKRYQAALPDLRELWPGANIEFGNGGIGVRLRGLKLWLETLVEQ